MRIFSIGPAICAADSARADSQYGSAEFGKLVCLSTSNRLFYKYEGVSIPWSSSPAMEMNNTTDTSSSGGTDMSNMMMMKAYLHFTKGDTVLFDTIVPSSNGAIVGTCIILCGIAVLERWFCAFTRGVQKRFQVRLVASIALVVDLLLQSKVRETHQTVQHRRIGAYEGNDARWAFCSFPRACAWWPNRYQHDSSLSAHASCHVRFFSICPYLTP